MKHAAEQWWKPSNQIPLQSAQTSHEILELAVSSLDDTFSSFEGGHIFLDSRATLLRARLFLIQEENLK